MDGFKETTKTHYVSGPKSSPKDLRGAAQTCHTMRTFKTGDPTRPGANRH